MWSYRLKATLRRLKATLGSLTARGGAALDRHSKIKRMMALRVLAAAPRSRMGRAPGLPYMPRGSAIPTLSSRVAFCVSPIRPTTRSIASGDMKQPFGATLARSCLHAMPWIAANRRKDGAFPRRRPTRADPTNATSAEFRARRYRHC